MRKTTVTSALKVFPAGHVTPVEGMAETLPAQLISDCIAGYETAIEMFVRQHEAGIFRLALAVVGDTAEANEITQETFLAALRSLPAYQERKSLRAWLYTIALNYSRSHLRKRRVRERLQATLTAIFQIEKQEQASPEETLIQNEKEAAVWKELNQLDDRHRIVIILRYFHELPVAEIAEILSTREGTVHSRLHHARERLRGALNHLHGDSNANHP